MEAAVRHVHVCPLTQFLLSCNGLAPQIPWRQGVSVPVDWCPRTARHLDLSKHGRGVQCKHEGVSEGVPGVSEGFRGFHPTRHNPKDRKSCRRYAEKQKLRTCV